jgi:hypothetical protein
LLSTASVLCWTSFISRNAFLASAISLFCRILLHDNRARQKTRTQTL